MTDWPEEWSPDGPTPPQARDWLEANRTDRDPAIAELCNKVIAEAIEHHAGPQPRSGGTAPSPFVSDDPPEAD